MFRLRLAREVGGPGQVGGRTIHVGTDGVYVALYMPPAGTPFPEDQGQLNHVGLQVDDLGAIERKVIEAGYRSYGHGDYEPGRRFYFRDKGGVEFEVVSYS